jgi:hypothetical protein
VPTKRPNKKTGRDGDANWIRAPRARSRCDMRASVRSVENGEDEEDDDEDDDENRREDFIEGRPAITARQRMVRGEKSRLT